MPVLLDQAQEFDIQRILSQIPASTALVTAIEDGERVLSTHRVFGIGSLGSASNQEISFIVGTQFLSQLAQTQAAVVILAEDVSKQFAQKYGAAPFVQVICPQPYLLYALLAQWFDVRRQPPRQAGVHPTAVVDPSAQVDPSATIEAFVTIAPKCVIGPGVHIKSGCSIGHQAQIGADSILHARVTLYDSVVIGKRAIIHSGAVIGADGFGFAPNPMMGKGAWGKIAQLGSVLVGDDVEIGANTTIDRGALDNTRIGHGVKLDNQIMIAHNCVVGDHTAMAACVGMAGSTHIGARCTVGGASMLSGHLNIVDDVHISGGTAVTSDITEPGRYTGVFPFATHAQWQKNAAVISQLAQIRKRVMHAEKALAEREPEPVPESNTDSNPIQPSNTPLNRND